MTESLPVLRMRSVGKRFGEVAALSEVDFDLRPGEVHAICGENGAGKSTLIKILSGLWAHGSYEGVVEVNGREARFAGIQDSERAGIAVIYQELALVPGMTVAENIFLGAEPTKMGRVDWNMIFSRTRTLMEDYGLDIDPAREVGSLGIGKQQLVEIVKVLAKNSRILLLDEPTAALTETEVEFLLKIVRDLKKRGIACIYISHKLDEVMTIADRITVLRDGISVATLQKAETNRAEIIRHMVGRSIEDYFPRRRQDVGASLLDVRGLTVREHVSGKYLLKDVSFSVRAGEVVGIGGLMGAGRTEMLMHIFAGQGYRESGTVLVGGKELRGNGPADAITRGLMLVSEDRKRYGLVLDQSIGFNLSLSSLRRFIRHGMMDETSEFLRNEHFFQSLGIRAPNQSVAVGTLSGGNQQKVVLGKALMTEPNVVFLDEPTRGIDVGAKVEVYELINRLTAQGAAVVMVSSELQELMGMSDRMVILSHGQVGGEFGYGEATQEALLSAAMAHH